MLDDWKCGSQKRAQTLNKDVFPALLTKLYTLLYPTYELKSRNLQARFKMCGISPLNELQVLSRLPDSDCTDNGDANVGSPVKHRVSAEVIDMLADMRGVDKDVEPRRRKITVAPGKNWIKFALLPHVFHCIGYRLITCNNYVYMTFYDFVKLLYQDSAVVFCYNYSCAAVWILPVNASEGK